MYIHKAVLKMSGKLFYLAAYLKFCIEVCFTLDKS